MRLLTLGIVKHNDRHNVATFFGREGGTIACLVPAKSPRRAPLWPLMEVEAEPRAKAGAELHTLHKYAILNAWPQVFASPPKTAIVFFLSEFLLRLFRHAEADEQLYDFMVQSMHTLSTTPKPANFHLGLLATLAHYMGIAPDTDDFTPRSWFDFRAARFTQLAPRHSEWLAPPEAAAVKIATRLTPQNSCRLHLSRETRRRFLENMLHYYSVHLPGLEGLRSPSVLTTLFAI